MAQQTINYGTAPGGAGGDNRRAALEKLEANDTELYAGVAAAQATADAAASAASMRTSFKNKLINGNLDIWQRGTSLAAFQAAAKYLADRFNCTAGGSTIAPSQQSFAVGQTAVPNGPKFYHRTVVASSAGAGNYALMTLYVEGLEQCSGKTYTLSFWAKADAAKSIGIEIQKNYGSGGSSSTADNALYTTSKSLTTAWKQYTHTFTVASTAGKTYGTNNNDALQIAIWFDCGSSFTSRGTIGQQSGTFDMAQFQLEEGTLATSFEARPFPVELAMCQRYFEKSYQLNVAPGTPMARGQPNFVTWAPVAGANASIRATFKVTKRSVPALSTFDDSGAVTRVSFLNGGAWADGGNISAVFVSTDSAVIVVNGMTVGISQLECNWAADAEL